ncbi:hypothetical protein ES707_22429 [subsurface metagenome]
MIRRQIGLDRDARRRVRHKDFADRARRRRHRGGHRRRQGHVGLGGAEFTWRGDKLFLRSGRAVLRLRQRRIGQFRPRHRRHRRHRKARRLRLGRGEDRRYRGSGRRRRCRRRGAHIAQVALDHGEAVDDMAERGVHGLQRIRGAAIGFRLAVADVGQLALDDVDQTGIHRRGRRKGGLPAVVGNGGEIGVLVFQMAQDVGQRILDPAEIAAAAALVGHRLDTLQQIRDALLEMRECGGVVIADRHAVDAFGQRTDRVFKIFVVVVFKGTRLLAALDGRGQRGDAPLDHGKRVVVTG